MAQFEIDPNNLKSFQRISSDDVRHLKALGEASALARANQKLAPGWRSDSCARKTEPDERFAFAATDSETV